MVFADEAWVGTVSLIESFSAQKYRVLQTWHRYGTHRIRRYGPSQIVFLIDWLTSVEWHPGQAYLLQRDVALTIWTVR